MLSEQRGRARATGSHGMKNTLWKQTMRARNLRRRRQQLRRRKPWRRRWTTIAVTAPLLTTSITTATTTARTKTPTLRVGRADVPLVGPCAVPPAAAASRVAPAALRTKGRAGTARL
eukprot:8246887-Pyramimonas_sp.AAC.1